MRCGQLLLGSTVLLASCGWLAPDPLEESLGAVTEASQAAFGRKRGYPVEPWLELFTEDATIVMARAQAQAGTDYAMSRLQYGGVVRMQHCRHQYMGPDFKVRSHRVVGDDVELTIELDLPGEVVAARLTMRKLDGKWRAVKSRHWRERWYGMHGEVFELDQAHWTKVDADVDAWIAKGSIAAAMSEATDHQAYGRVAQLRPDTVPGTPEDQREYAGQIWVRGGLAVEGVRWINNDPEMSKAEVRRYLVDWCATEAREDAELD